MKSSILIILSCMLSACLQGPVGNTNVPQPAKAVELERYLGKWYEIARYENRFEKGYEGVTAEYAKREDGLIHIINTCREGNVNGPVKVADGKAKIVEDSNGAKLKVSFFGPFYIGDYWVLDHAEDYSWSIVGEPSGKYLWLLARNAKLKESEKNTLISKIKALGYDISMLRFTQQPPATP